MTYFTVLIINFSQEKEKQEKEDQEILQSIQIHGHFIDNMKTIIANSFNWVNETFKFLEGSQVSKS